MIYFLAELTPGVEMSYDLAIYYSMMWLGKTFISELCWMKDSYRLDRGAGNS